MSLAGWAEDDLSLQPDARGRAVPDRVFDLERLELELALDPVDRSVEGTARWTARRLGVGPMVLDQVALEISQVREDGQVAEWWVQGDHLFVDVTGDQVVIEVDYRATPDTGLHFREAGRHSPDEYSEVWSQGQAQDNRHWIPGWDHPNERFDYEGRITAPDGWKVLTNSGPDRVLYLLMLTAGPYEVYEDDFSSVWVAPGTDSEAVARVLDPVGSMMNHFTERTGVPYAWAEYRQVFVQRFLYGGMENTSATINTDTVLVPDSIEQTREARVQGLVAHELAHQWYGDLLTCRTWRDLWLNEGFATFMAADWTAATQGDPSYWANRTWSWYRSSRDTGVLAGRFHQGPDGPRNGRVYSKGASVLQMLRAMLGEEVFWAGIQRYTTTHQHQLVRTWDLQEAFEIESGQELDWFFQQWVELPWNPKLTVSHRFGDGQLVVTVKQSVGDRPVYTLPVTIEVGTAEGPVRRRAWMEADRLEISLPLESAPSYVAFDPDGGLLAEVEQKQDPDAWAEQLGSVSPYARRLAIEALAETDRSEELVALASSVASVEPSDGGERGMEERLAAIDALGRQRVVEPLSILLSDSSDRVRLAAASALGSGTSDEAVSDLRRVIRKDSNGEVRARALGSLSRLDADLAVFEARSLVGLRGLALESLSEEAA
ncbi:MAG: M1 family metallopeptidase, partial [Myxococcota bacterium]|nr:M1 family metallopeptidase [Myxococcota bacterium]